MNTALTWVLRGACSVVKVKTEAGRLLSSRRNRRREKRVNGVAPVRRESWGRAAPRTAAETYLGPACNASRVGVLRAGRVTGARRCAPVALFRAPTATAVTPARAQMYGFPVNAR